MPHAPRLPYGHDQPSLRDAMRPAVALPSGLSHPGGGAPQLGISDPWLIAADQFRPKETFQDDPLGWLQRRTKEFAWSEQQRILQSVLENRYTAVQSCHDAGKSFIAARAAAWWIDAHPPGEAFVVSTAPTAAQVYAILWREISRTHKKGELDGTITTAGFPQWKIDGEIVGYGRKPAEYSESAFQGIHARFVLVIMDEACGIEKTLFDAVDSLATNEYARVLAIGNPDDPTSHFAEVCRPDSGWNVIRIDGLRTPNFTREAVLSLKCAQCRSIHRSTTLLADLFRREGLAFTEEVIPDDLRPMLLSPLWVEERLHRWVGRVTEAQDISKQALASSLFTAKVRGLFPTDATEGVIPLGWVERAMARYRDWVDAGSPELPGRIIISVDVARGGEDTTCIATRHGLAVTMLDQYPTADTMETTGNVVAKLRPFRGETGYVARAVVDTIGVGAGVYDRLKELGVPTEPFTASASARGLTDITGEFIFPTLRSAAWWNLRELLDPSRRSSLMLIDDEILKADLCAPRWRILSGGKIQVELKDDVRKRLGRSTDKGDAVVMAYYDMLGAMDDTGEPRAVDWYSEAETSRLTVVRWNDEHDDWAVNPDVSLESLWRQ